MSSPRRYTMSAEDVVRLARILRYKACRSIFKVLRSEGTVNISGIVRKTGCKDSAALRHLRNLIDVGAVREEWIGGNHVFSIQPGEVTTLLEEAVRLREKGGNGI